MFLLFIFPYRAVKYLYLSL